MILAWASPPVIAVIVILVALFFYRKRIPLLGKSLGQNLRKGKRSFDRHHEKMDEQAELQTRVAAPDEDVARPPRQRERDEV
jgi:Sec-independent protein translocase protein TatA